MLRLLSLLLLLAAPARAETLRSASYEVQPAWTTAGGQDDTASAANYRLGGAVGEVSGARMNSPTDFQMLMGLRQLMAYPGAPVDLAAFTDLGSSSVTLRWSAPGADGAFGRLQPGSSYYLVVTTYTAPTPYVLPNYDVFLATDGTAGGGVAAGAVVGTNTVGLLPNNTYYAHLWTLDPDGNASYASARATFTMLALPARLNQAPDLYAYYVGDTSVTLQWAGLVPTPTQASSASAQGFVLYASSTNYGALTPGGVVYSSRTNDVTVSTLTVGADAPLDYCTTYYFRLATLNWADAENLLLLHSSATYDDDAVTMTVHSIDIGEINMATVFVIPTGVDVENQGRCPATYALKAGTVTVGSPWTINGVSGFDQYTLSAGFDAAQPAAGDFGAEDLMTDSAAAATPTRFGIGQTGYRVPRGEFRKLWFRLETPTITSTDADQDVRVTIIAVRDPP